MHSTSRPARLLQPPTVPVAGAQSQGPASAPGSSPGPREPGAVAGTGWQGQGRADRPPAEWQVGMRVGADVMPVRPGGYPLARPAALLAGLWVGGEWHPVVAPQAGTAGWKGLCHRAGQGSVSGAQTPSPGGAQQRFASLQLLGSEHCQVRGFGGLREKREEGASRSLGSGEGAVVAALGQRAPLRGPAGSPRLAPPGHVGQGCGWSREPAAAAPGGPRTPALWIGLRDRVGRGGPGAGTGRRWGPPTSTSPVLDGARGAVQGAAHPRSAHHVPGRLQHLQHAGLGRAGCKIRAGLSRGAGQALHPAEAAVDALGRDRKRGADR